VDSTGDAWVWDTGDMEDESDLEYSQMGYVGDDDIYAARIEGGKCFFYDTSYVKRGVMADTPEWLGLYAQGYCPVKYAKGYALVDLYGETLIDGLEYAGSFQDGYACISKEEGTWSLIDTSGKETGLQVEQVVCDDAGRYTYQERALASDGKAYYFYDSELSEKKGSFSCADVDVLTEDGWLAFQDEQGKWGYVDMDGEVKIEPQYEAARSFSHGVAAVCVDGKWGYINESNTLVVEPQFTACGYVSEAGIGFVQDDTDFYRTITFRYPDLLSGE
jgi:hypothetical protein